MKAYFLPFVFPFALMLARLASAQDADRETEAALRQASEAAKKMGIEMPNVKKMMEEDAKEEAKEEAKVKVQAAISAPGPVAFPGLDAEDPRVHSCRTSCQKGCR